MTGIQFGRKMEIRLRLLQIDMATLIFLSCHPNGRSARHGQGHFIVPQTNSKCNLRKPDHEY